MNTSKLGSMEGGMISHLSEYLNVEDTKSLFNFSSNFLNRRISDSTQAGNPINQKWKDDYEYKQQLIERKRELHRLSTMSYWSNPGDRLAWHTEEGDWKDLTEGQDPAGLLNPPSGKVVPDIRIIIHSSMSIGDVNSAIALVHEILDQDEDAGEDLVEPVKDPYGGISI